MLILNSFSLDTIFIAIIVLAVLLIIASLFGTVTTLCDMADRERETIGVTDARGRV